MIPTAPLQGFELDLGAKRMVVMGLGRFGGGVGVTRYLAGRAARVLVTDLLPAQALGDSLARLEGLPVDYRLGGHEVRDFTTADVVVVNPAVDHRRDPFVQAARQAGVTLTSEIELLVTALPNRRKTMGITGTAGKSTVTAMIGHILDCAYGHGRVYTGGNLGGSLLDHIGQITPDDWVVLELSSFMLERLSWSPHTAIVTNLFANHLDRHGSMTAYAEAKQTILGHQAPDDQAVMGPDVHTWLDPVTDRIHRVTDPAAVSLKTPGQHNQLNAALAIRAVRCVGIDAELAIDTLKGFAGLPHRLQWVGCYRDIEFYNDSKATTPKATQLAIRSFETGRDADSSWDGGIHVIVGGYDKRHDVGSLGQFVGKHCRGVYTIGATGDAIAQAAQAIGGSVFRCGTLDCAVQSACAQARGGDVVLLSPGCASWDQFTHYEQRGDAFIQAVLRYAAQRRASIAR